MTFHRKMLCFLRKFTQFPPTYIFFIPPNTLLGSPKPFFLDIIHNLVYIYTLFMQSLPELLFFVNFLLSL